MVVCSLWLASCLVGFLDTVFRLGVNEDEMHVKSRECAGIEDIKSNCYSMFHHGAPHRCAVISLCVGVRE